MKNTTFMNRLRALRVVAAAAIAFGAAGAACAATTPLADQPILVADVPANVALALSVEFPTAITRAHQNSFVGAASSPYLGYFDPKKCYKYNSGTSGYFEPTGKSGTNYTCSGAWSGHFLNWATMQGADIFRWALTGGNRSTDTPKLFDDGTANQTILDVVTYIQRNLDPTVAYRFACRVGGGILFGCRHRPDRDVIPAVAGTMGVELRRCNADFLVDRVARGLPLQEIEVLAGRDVVDDDHRGRRLRFVRRPGGKRSACRERGDGCCHATEGMFHAASPGRMALPGCAGCGRRRRAPANARRRGCCRDGVVRRYARARGRSIGGSPARIARAGAHRSDADRIRLRRVDAVELRGLRDVRLHELAVLGQRVHVRVNDRGPFERGTVIDLSYAAAAKLGILRGATPVEVERLTFDMIRSGNWKAD